MNLVSVPNNKRPQPDMFHARIGHALPLQNSKIHSQLLKTLEYAKNNGMEINFKNTTVMIFNPYQSCVLMTMI